METATEPGAECAHVTVFCPMKSYRHMSPGDRSENNKKSYFHCTVIIITSFKKFKKNIAVIQGWYRALFTAIEMSWKKKLVA